MKYFLLLSFFFFSVQFGHAQTSNQKADPAAINITNTPSLPLLGFTDVVFTLGNQGTDPILPGTVEWTMNFNSELLDVTPIAVSIPEQFVMSPVLNLNGDVIIKFRTILSILPMQNNLQIIFKVRGIVEGTGFVSQNVKILPGSAISVGNISGNDNFTNPLDVTSGVLPVTWLSFDVSKNENSVLLDWKTASEQQTLHFIVERSTDALHYTSVALIKAAGNSAAITSYNYKDQSPLDGINYYRLKQVDINGRFTYSVVKNINFYKGKKVALKMYPNPANSVVNIIAPIGFVELFDLSGKQIQKYRNINNLLSINVSGLAAGIYVVKATDNQGTVVSARLAVTK